MPISDFLMEYIFLPFILIFTSIIILFCGLIYALWDFPFTWYVFMVYAPSQSKKNVTAGIITRWTSYIFNIIPNRAYQTGSNEEITEQYLAYTQYKK